MRSESYRINKREHPECVITSLFNTDGINRFVERKAKEIVSKHVTKQILEDYLRKIKFSGFKNNKEFQWIGDISSQFWYDYARHWDECEDLYYEVYQQAVKQFPKRELINAVYVLTKKNIDEYLDIHAVREIAAEEIRKALESGENDMSEYRNDFVLDLIYYVLTDEIELQFKKWFFPELKGNRVSPPKKKQPRKIQVNVRRMF